MTCSEPGLRWLNNRILLITMKIFKIVSSLNRHFTKVESGYALMILMCVYVFADKNKRWYSKIFP